jgi:peptide-methionine (S)-S-oxide reductase
MEKIGLGGSCHWCTEAIFQSLLGVHKVYQGWVSSEKFSEFSEAVIVEFDPKLISLNILIEIHLHTHSCTSNHSLRTKYRSAVYGFDAPQIEQSKRILNTLQTGFEKELITKVLTVKEFKLNKEEYLNYYYSDPSKPFCENIINPKLQILLEKYMKYVDKDKLRIEL